MPKRKQPVTIASNKQSSPYGSPKIAVPGKLKALKKRASKHGGK